LLSIGRFDLVRTLGRGGHGVVYEAFDQVRREAVALKVLYEDGPRDLYRLKREFRSLAELRHPNLVALHELSIADEAYFTMDLIRGCDFFHHVQKAGLHEASALARAREALAQLCEGVQALHSAGKLHRDLKPSNILVTDAGRVVLLDFGLVDDVRAERTKPEGTPAYMAPEQAHGAACVSSDWYSFGCVLRETLKTLPSALADDDALRGLGRLAQRLLDPDPALRPAFDEIIATVRGSCGPDQASSRSATEVRAQAGSSFVAREAELRRLGDAFARSSKQPVVVLVRGESGIGKSALLRHFANTLDAGADPRALVLHGRCYERESVPFKGLDSAIDELSRFLCALPSEHGARKGLGGDPALLAVFPVLGRVPWLRSELTPLADLDRVDLNIRGFAALRALLARLAAERPLVICIDDMQWSDPDSGRLLGALLCEEDSPRVLVVATDRYDSRFLNPAIEELQRVAELSPRPLCVEELELGPLRTADSLALAHGLLAGIPNASAVRIGQIVAEARGNPRVLIELSRWVAERAHPPAIERVPPSIGALLERRLSGLSESSRTMLELIAAAGRPLSTSVIAAAAGIGIECHACVKELRAAGLLRAALRGQDEWLELDHERIRDAVVQHLNESERVELHARLVRALRVDHGGAGEALVDQYLGAGMPFEAARCARHLADGALAALAFTRAARLYDQALALGRWSPQERAALHRDHAVALERAGRGLEAAAAYERAAELSTDSLAAAHLVQRAAVHLMRNGCHREGEELLRRGYRALELVWPSGPFALVLAIAEQLLPAWIRRRLRRARDADQGLQRARAEFLTGAGRGLENYDLLRTLHNALLRIDVAEQIPDPIWHARARAERGLLRGLLLWPGGAERGIIEIQRACRTVAEIGDVAAEGELENQLAVAHYFSGRPAAALEAAKRSEACLRSIPYPAVDRNLVITMIGSALFDLGRLREARQCWRGLTHAARLHGDVMTAVWVHAHPSRLAVLFANDETAQSQAILDLAARLRARHPRYAMLGWIHATGSLEHALYSGAPEDALAIAQREHGILFGSSYPLLGERARIHRARAYLNAASARTPGRARAPLLRCAARDIGRSSRKRNAYHRGLWLLLSAGIAALQERPGRAIDKLDEAIAAFAASEALLFAACARYCKGALLGGNAGRRLKGPALAALQAEGVVDPRRCVAWLASGFRGIIDGER
jgi:tetratricopeptide (TPR) repeat protein